MIQEIERDRVKGSGKRTVTSLSGEQKAKLLFYAKDNGQAFTTKPCQSLAIEVGQKLGFPISPASILWARHSVYPEMTRKLGPRNGAKRQELSEIKERIMALEVAVQRIARDLGIGAMIELAEGYARQNGSGCAGSHIAD
jgi:hypothetical protein